MRDGHGQWLAKYVSTTQRRYPVSTLHTPDDAHDLPPHQSGENLEQAREAVRKVIDAYGTRQVAARRDPTRHAPDLVADWGPAREQAMDDLDRVTTADPDETVQISLTYVARLKALQAEGRPEQGDGSVDDGFLGGPVEE